MITDEKLKQLDALFALLYKYELHAFILLACGVAVTFVGFKEEGFAIIGAALLIFRNKASTPSA